MMDTNRTVEELCQEQQITLKQLVERCGLEEATVTAIVLGRWTPSPAQRDRRDSIPGSS